MKTDVSHRFVTGHILFWGSLWIIKEFLYFRGILCHCAMYYNSRLKLQYFNLIRSVKRVESKISWLLTTVVQNVTWKKSVSYFQVFGSTGKIWENVMRLRLDCTWCRHYDYHVKVHGYSHHPWYVASKHFPTFFLFCVLRNFSRWDNFQEMEHHWNLTTYWHWNQTFLKVSKIARITCSNATSFHFMWHVLESNGHFWSPICIYERPILGESPKPHFLAKYGFQCRFYEIRQISGMKFTGFHEIQWISCEIWWISCVKALNQITQQKNFTFNIGQGEAMWYKIMKYGGFHVDFIWNPPIQQDFTKTNRISLDFMKSTGFNTISLNPTQFY